MDTRPAAPAENGALRASAPSIEPALVRVSVLGGNTQLDVALPAAVPVAALLGDQV
ncbi:MAG: type VII secretion integral membrane protein EccD, partial [Gordonia polyisoprenivorans]|nr:type VII secretion integral membrane protein EccD [Gordonia polyisoprenivorans]